MYTDKELHKEFEKHALKPIYNFINYGGETLHYATIGADSLPLLVLIHGAPGAWYLFLNQFLDTSYTNHFKLLAVDRIGYGKSNYGKVNLSTLWQAKLIREAILKENSSKKKVVLLGRSYGAPIAAYIAIKDSAFCKKVIMISPVIDPNIEKFYWFSKLGKYKTVQCMLPKALNVATKEKYTHALEMKKMQDMWQYLYTPTVVFTGEFDKIASPKNYNYADSIITKSFLKKMILVKGGSHFVMSQVPGLVYENIIK